MQRIWFGQLVTLRRRRDTTSCSDVVSRPRLEPSFRSRPGGRPAWTGRFDTATTTGDRLLTACTSYFFFSKSGSFEAHADALRCTSRRHAARAPLQPSRHRPGAVATSSRSPGRSREPSGFTGRWVHPRAIAPKVNPTPERPLHSRVANRTGMCSTHPHGRPQAPLQPGWTAFASPDGLCTSTAGESDGALAPAPYPDGLSDPTGEPLHRDREIAFARIPRVTRRCSVPHRNLDALRPLHGKA